MKHLEQFHGPKTNLTDVVNELNRLETPLASVAKSLCSELYEYEIGVEYDVEKNGTTTEKRDIFSGVIKLPKIMGYQGTKNLIFGHLEIGQKSLNHLKDLQKAIPLPPPPAPLNAIENN